MSNFVSSPPYQRDVLRPDIVLHGELLARGTLSRIDRWLDNVPRVDLRLVVGTAAHVSANFMHEARELGARVAHFGVRRHEDSIAAAGDVAATLPAVVERVLQGRVSAS